MFSKMADLMEIETYNKNKRLRKQATEKLDHIEKAIQYLEENLK